MFLINDVKKDRNTKLWLCSMLLVFAAVYITFASVLGHRVAIGVTALGIAAHALNYGLRKRRSRDR